MDLGVLFTIGIGVFGGVAGAWAFERLKFPNVVGYIVIGLAFGISGFGIIDADAIAQFESFNLFALGLIGFLVGGELLADTFRKHGKQFFAILLAEGLAAFFLVSLSTGALAYVVTGRVDLAMASGVVFGAIASATDPASTVDVLWQYRARGMVTTALIAIVALDDALAMTLYGIGTSVAQLLVGGDNAFAAEAIKVVRELGGAGALGALSAITLIGSLRWLGGAERGLAMCLGILFIAIGLAHAAGIDVILTSMTMGVVLVNIDTTRSKPLFAVVRSFSGPIYIMFFVLVGARLSIGSMPGWLWGIVALYVSGRSAGKFVGAYIGARLSGAPKSVQRYCGVGLMAQAGIAVGLSLMASQHLQGIEVTAGLSLGDMIVAAVTATTFIVQLAGPPLVKLAIRMAGEAGRNVTEEDVIRGWTVENVMSRDVYPIRENMPLTEVWKVFAEHDHLIYPVVANDGRLIGLLALEDLKEVIGNQYMWDWIVAGDVKMPVAKEILAATPLAEALEAMRTLDVDELPVVEGNQGSRPIGVLDLRTARKCVKEEVLQRQQAIELELPDPTPSAA